MTDLLVPMRDSDTDAMNQLFPPSTRRLRQLAHAQRVTARVLVSNVLSRLATTIPTKQQFAVARKVLRDPGGAIRLQNEMIARIVRNGAYLTKAKYRNTVWDLHTATTVAAITRLHQTPVWLVTDDRAILEASASTDNDDVIHSLADYQERIERADLF